MRNVLSHSGGCADPVPIAAPERTCHPPGRRVRTGTYLNGNPLTFLDPTWTSLVLPPAIPDRDSTYASKVVPARLSWRDF